MRTPGSVGDLFPVAIPGLLVIGAIGVLVLPTTVGALAFGGPVVQLLLGIVTGALVFGYLLAGLQDWLASLVGPWTLPPASHLSPVENDIVLPAPALERAGYRCQEVYVAVPLGSAYALERALAGAWGTPEGAGWDRTAFLQRMTLAFGLAGLLGLGWLVVAAATGNLTQGVRSHAGAVFVLGTFTTFLVGRAASRARREAVIELFADARALLLDRGEFAEVRRVLNQLGLELSEEDLGASVRA